MTEVDEKLLLIDLCGRLIYNVKCLVHFPNDRSEVMVLKSGLPNTFGKFEFSGKNISGYSNEFKPYLRSFSNMTEEEHSELSDIFFQRNTDYEGAIKVMDFFYSHHIDCRHLIEKGLAIDCTNLNIY